MQRRSFVTSAVSALTTAAIVPWQNVLAATDSAGEVPATGAAGKQLVLKPSDLDDLRGSLRGQLLVPGQEGYDAARKVWNGAFDRRPAVIVRVAGGADIRQAVQFARANNLVVAVRGGGHSLSGQSASEGGLLIDLSQLKSVSVDPLTQRARVESGVLLGQYDKEAQAFGLASTAGTVSHTGVAGLTLGGGFGRIARKYALACDNLTGAELITADGNFVKVSEEENPNLLWGLRGGGGNFGVVTSFEFRLHKVDPIMYGGSYVLPFANGRKLLRAYADFIGGASDEMYAGLAIVPTPNGRVAVLDVCHCGTKAAAEKEIAQLRKLGKPLQDGLAPTPYVKLQNRDDGNFPHGRGYYIKSGFVRTLTPKVIDTVVDFLDANPLPTGIVNIVHQGGAIARVKPDATAFWNRAAEHSVMLIGFWDDPKAGAAPMQWVRTGWKGVEPLTDGFYINEVSNEDPAHRIQENYGGNYSRLASLKKRFDPTNVFHMNANIKPEAA
jgi:hypothetical protein